MEKYLDRSHAGKLLAEELKEYADRQDVIILALPRGGVPVAYEIASCLHLPLDVFVVRKLGVPGNEEFAMGAIASGGTVVLNQGLIEQLSLSQAEVNAVIHAEEIELDRRNEAYRQNKPFPDLKNKTIILVDDGIATGATMEAAVDALQQHDPATIVIAVPVAARDSYLHLFSKVSDIVCPLLPDYFNAVGQWYETFSQTSDEEVYDLLRKANQ